MDIIKRNKILIWTAIILLIGNISIVSTIWYKSPKKKKNIKKEYREDRNDRGKGNFLINELDLSTDQIILYKEARLEHREDLNILRDSIRNNKHRIHEELFKGVSDTTFIKQLADSIGKLNAQFEKTNYSYFIKLKNFLDNEQLEKLKEIMNHKSFTGDHQKHRKRRSKRE